MHNGNPHLWPPSSLFSNMILITSLQGSLLVFLLKSLNFFFFLIQCFCCSFVGNRELCGQQTQECKKNGSDSTASSQRTGSGKLFIMHGRLFICCLFYFQWLIKSKVCYELLELSLGDSINNLPGKRPILAYCIKQPFFSVLLSKQTNLCVIQYNAYYWMNIPSTSHFSSRVLPSS